MHEKITTILKELLSRASFGVDDIEISLDQDLGITKYSIKTDDPKLLIGRNGDVLRAVNQLVRLMFEHQYPEFQESDQNFLIDVNGYHSRKLNDLKTKARIVADRARSFKSDIALNPMSAYDRLIVHSFISQLEDIESESHGEGLERHVVVKYVG
jgi:spoIIIJ-associated protein